MQLTVSKLAVQLTVRDHTFRLGRRGILLPDDISYEAWAELYESAWILEDVSTWALADLLVYGLQHYPDEAYNIIGDVTRMSRGRLMNIKSVAENVPRENRVFDLSFSHYTEAAKVKDKEEQRAWLAWAEQSEASRDDLRLALSGENTQPQLAPAVMPSTPVSALYWIRDWLNGKASMTRQEVLAIVNEMIRRYALPEDEE